MAIRNLTANKPALLTLNDGRTIPASLRTVRRLTALGMARTTDGFGKRAEWITMQPEKWNAPKSAPTGRICYGCHAEKPLTEFDDAPYTSSIDGISWYCRQCERDRDTRKAASYSEIRHVREKYAEGSHAEQEWRELCAKYGNRCLACGSDGPLTRDHVRPISKGGTDYINNIQPLCRRCNSSKCDREIDYRTKQNA